MAPHKRTAKPLPRNILAAIAEVVAAADAVRLSRRYRILILGHIRKRLIPPKRSRRRQRERDRTAQAAHDWTNGLRGPRFYVKYVPNYARLSGKGRRRAQDKLNARIRKYRWRQAQAQQSIAVKA